MGDKPAVTIAYCRQCNWMLRAAWMAQELLSTFSEELGAVTLVPGTGGIFEIRVEGELVWERKRDGGFPDVKALKRLVRDRVSPERGLGHVDRAGAAVGASSGETVRPALIAHCDWSMSAGKRWMTVAKREGERWKVSAPELVGETLGLFERLHTRAGGKVLVGFDFPIGLPVAYGRKTGLSDFPSALRAFGRGEWADWYRVCEVSEEIAITRPFYPMRSGGTSQDHLVTGLGVGSMNDLLRACDRPTADRRAACAIFWTLGGNQVGKAAIAGWLELIVPHLDEVGLWPFSGSLFDLVAKHDVVVAETYPGDAYRQVGVPKGLRWSKTSAEGRRAALPYARAWIDARPVATSDALVGEIDAGFADDDRFDSFMGLCGMLDVVDGRRREGPPLEDSVLGWEGWILGQGGGG